MHSSAFLRIFAQWLHVICLSPSNLSFAYNDADTVNVFASSCAIARIRYSFISSVFTSSFLLIAHTVSCCGAEEKPPLTVMVLPLLPFVVIAFTSTLEFSEN